VRLRARNGDGSSLQARALHSSAHRARRRRIPTRNRGRSAHPPGGRAGTCVAARAARCRGTTTWHTGYAGVQRPHGTHWRHLPPAAAHAHARMPHRSRRSGIAARNTEFLYTSSFISSVIRAGAPSRHWCANARRGMACDARARRLLVGTYSVHVMTSSSASSHQLLMP
jgi:hypothetical protein